MKKFTKPSRPMRLEGTMSEEKVRIAKVHRSPLYSDCDKLLVRSNISPVSMRGGPARAYVALESAVSVWRCLIALHFEEGHSIISPIYSLRPDVFTSQAVFFVGPQGAVTDAVGYDIVMQGIPIAIHDRDPVGVKPSLELLDKIDEMIGEGTDWLRDWGRFESVMEMLRFQYSNEFI